MRNYIIGVLFILILSGYTIKAQKDAGNTNVGLNDKINSITPKNTTFMVRGYSHFGLDINKDEVTFAYGQFAPIFLWKQGNRFIFETELELEFEDNELKIGLEYANGSYIIADGLIIRAGLFLLPFGTFSERLHPAWINKVRSKPLGFGHDGIGPSSDFGINIRGGLQIGKSKLNYDVYVVNGPTLKSGVDEPEEAGMLSFETNIPDNNKNKAIGARIGFLPISNSSLEVGLSGYYAKPGSEHSPFEGDSLLEELEYSDVTAFLYSIDLSYVKNISAIKGIIDIKGQYTYSNVSEAEYYDPEDAEIYTFKNMSNAYYAQLSYRPALLDVKVVKNLEIVGRYSEYNTPEGSLWYANLRQWTVGVNYWFSWRSVLKLSYENLSNNASVESDHEEEEDAHGPLLGNAFFIHWAIGF